MNRIVAAFGVIVLSLCSSGFAGGGAMNFYVATSGSDSYSGRVAQVNGNHTDGPFATLGKAVEAAEQFCKNDSTSRPVAIILRGGVHQLAAGIRLSSAFDMPVSIEAFKGEDVHLAGARVLSGFAAVKDQAVLARLEPQARGKVVCVDLKKLGITDYGKLQARGFSQPVRVAQAELFFGDKPMQLARYPNEGWLKIAAVPKGQNGGEFSYEGDRPKRWKAADDIWVHGYWTQDWADSYARVGSIDTENRIIKTVPPHGAYGYTKDHRFYAMNILDELDEPGEYYLDRDTGMLYWWPPEQIKGRLVLLSMVEQPLITLTNTRSVSIRGLTIEATRGTAIRIEGGSHNVVANCTIRNTGNLAVIVDGGKDNGVTSCLIYNTSDGAIRLSGGDRKTLTPAGLYATNNHIHHYSRWCRTYRPAIAINGVGNRAAHNNIHDAPHTAILFGGNNHLLEYNEVHEVCRETGDVGAFYTGRDWTTRGTVIRGNYFHDIHGPYTYGAMSVYLDDTAGGTTIVGNIFVRASRAAFIGGGRDNIVENNIFVDCNPAVHIDARGLNWAKKYMVPNGGWHIFERLRAVGYDKPPYSTQYPQLAKILDGDPAVPLGNIIRNNICVGGKWLDLQSVKPEWVTMKNNITEGDTGLVDPQNGDFRLKSDAAALKTGFKPIDTGLIGPHGSVGAPSAGR